MDNAEDDNEASPIEEHEEIVVAEEVPHVEEIKDERAIRKDDVGDSKSGFDHEEPMNTIVTWIRETEIVSTERQKEIQATVEEHLNDKLEDHKDVDGMSDAIETCGSRVSTWIDQTVKEVEREMESGVEDVPEEKKKKYSTTSAAVYHIKRTEGNYYRVTKVNVIS